ncbi:MAG TPA: carbonic anhydrase family protein [Flavobacteriales bacterium]
MRTQTKQSQSTLLPADALRILVDGNARFVNNLKANRNLLQQVNETREGQYPFAVILSCMDSRTSAELIFDQGLGDIFSIRIAGNFVNEDILGSIEYAVGVAGAKLILVLGHTACGAINGAIQDVQLGHLTGMLSNIKPAVERTAKEDDASGKSYSDRVASTNVCMAIDDIIGQSDVVRKLMDEGQVGVAGAMYNVNSGEVEFIQACQHVEQVVAEQAANSR